ncbi:MAG TPA: hypothetical protein VGG04_04135 [Candidatus Sulfotelmatobacter sp.]|jgi:hypothetical protein
MRTLLKINLMSCLAALALTTQLFSQQAQPPARPAPKTNEAPAADKEVNGYSGMYTFLKEGEFVQITVEDDFSVSGFISRYGEGESDKGSFLDQFFKTGKLAGKQLTFSTQLVHGVGFDFKGAFERGEGNNPGDDAYFVLKGTLTQNTTDLNKKVTSHSQEVVFKSFPQDAAPPR